MVSLRQEKSAGGPVISTLTASGGFTLDNGSQIDGPLILTPHSAMPWENAPQSAAALEMEHLSFLDMIAPPPEFIIIGTGRSLIRPPQSLVMQLDQRDIGIEVMDSRAAARVWMILRSEDRWTAAALWPIS